MEFCPTSEMIADLLTKPLAKLRLKCSAIDSPENITCNRAPKRGVLKYIEVIACFEARNKFLDMYEQLL